MKNEWWKGLETKKCTVCKCRRGYTNPMAKCFECKKPFCFDHIHCLQHKENMAENALLRDVCAKCIKKHGYKTI